MSSGKAEEAGVFTLRLPIEATPPLQDSDLNQLPFGLFPSAHFAKSAENINSKAAPKRFGNLIQSPIRNEQPQCRQVERASCLFPGKLGKSRMLARLEPHRKNSPSQMNLGEEIRNLSPHSTEILRIFRRTTQVICSDGICKKFRRISSFDWQSKG